MIAFVKSSLVLSVFLASALAAPMPQSGTKPFTLQNGKDAIDKNNKFATLNADSPCTAGEDACVEGKFAQCVGGKFVLTQCAAGTTCAALPLVNKAGTAIACTTEADKQSRISATGATTGKAPPAKRATPSAPGPAKPLAAANDANATAANATATNANATAADANAARANATTATPKAANATAANAKAANAADKPGDKKDDGKDKDYKADKADGKGKDGKGDKDDGKGKDGKGDKDDGKDKNMVLPMVRRAPQNTKPFTTQNGLDAQKQNAGFASLTPDSSCTDGENACVNSQFAQCVGGKFLLSSCGPTLECLALPLVNSKGTSITCVDAPQASQRFSDAGVGPSTTGQ